MTQQAPTALGPPVGGPSDRSLLERAALEAALALPGGVRGAAGPGVPRVTIDSGGRLVGVGATAQRDGRYAVVLRQIAGVVPLHPLADAVRARGQRAAAQAGLAPALGRVDIEFADLLTVEPEPRPGPADARMSAAGSACPATAAAPSPQLPATSGGSG